MPLKKGQAKTGGRKKGTPNKTTVSVKTALSQAFEGVGGVDALIKWGVKNPGPFFGIWSKMLPTEIKNADGESFRFSIGDDVRRRLAEVDGEGPGLAGEAGGAEPEDVADPAPPAGDQLPAPGAGPG